MENYLPGEAVFLNRLEQDEPVNSQPASEARRAKLQVQALPYERLNRLPSCIQQSLRNKKWCLIPREQRQLFRYHRDCQFWVCNNKGWQQVGFSEYDSDSQGLAFAPYKAAQPCSSGTTISSTGSSATTQQFSNSFFRTIGETRQNEATPTVNFVSPNSGDVIVLEKSNNTQQRFTEHNVAAGEDASTIAQQYTGKANPRLVYGFNDHVSPSSGLPQGTRVRVPSGWNIVIEGSVTNHSQVELKWSGTRTGHR